MSEDKYEHLLAEARRRRDEAQVIEVEEERTKLVVFSLGEELYAFEGKFVREVLRYEKITFVPGSSQLIHGIINVRGEIESVLNLHGMLGLADSERSSRSRIVMAVTDSVRSGILVDSVDDVADVAVSSIQPPLTTFEGPLKEYACGVSGYEGRNLVLISLSKVLAKLLH